MGKKIQGKEITPMPIGKIRKGAYYIPDCPDYEPRINIPKKVHIKEPFTGWNCRNCKNLEINVSGTRSGQLIAKKYLLSNKINV